MPPLTNNDQRRVDGDAAAAGFEAFFLAAGLLLVQHVLIVNKVAKHVNGRLQQAAAIVAQVQNKLFRAGRLQVENCFLDLIGATLGKASHLNIADGGVLFQNSPGHRR